MNDMTKNIVLWLVIAGVLYVVASSINTQPTQQMLNYSAFIDNVENGNVDQVTIGDTRISGQMNDGTRFETVKPPAMDTNLIPTLIQNEVEVTGKEPERQGFLTQLFLSVLPILLILAIFIFFMRQMQGGGKGGGGPMTFGKSKARLMGEDQIKTTFADVAGVEEAKDEVQELVEFLRDPAKFQRLGGKIPRGVLMVGSPGTGKPCSPRPSPAKPRCRSSAFPAPISWKCSSAWARPGSVTCSIRPRSTPPASSLSTRSTPSAAAVAPAWAAVMTSASRP